MYARHGCLGDTGYMDIGYGVGYNIDRYEDGDNGLTSFLKIASGINAIEWSF